MVRKLIAAIRNAGHFPGQRVAIFTANMQPSHLTPAPIQSLAPLQQPLVIHLYFRQNRLNLLQSLIRSILNLQVLQALHFS